ncbi:divergent PAP2 family protein [Paenibacillus sp. LMG 31456]|uniref:Divergent PAP2 family protein n=1 Tax=Paenibacillus foliorum TaxID=2654974 RepID=A0A972K063_9BACL|nr:divergent PAP2 family protein [Paenibacillus foliorum]NOU95304.1 divergent PAP2 family protein [Paenibacillus foliorum]
MNRALLTSVATIGLAQLIKIPIAKQRTGRWDWPEMFKTGGMPSSHSAGVASLAAYIGLKKGIDTIPFALAGMLSVIVMYDAMGIRRHAGNIATEVNSLEASVDRLMEESSFSSMDEKESKDRLEESLGHLPVEVLGGAILGICTGALSYVFEKQSTKRRLLSRWL